jgi:hypothetical protein
MELGFTARGTKKGNVTVTFDSGREISVSTGSLDEAGRAIAEMYFDKYPEGEVSARGTISIVAAVQ